MTRIGWIGTGVMGGRMVGHLIDAGHDVDIYARRPEAIEALLRAGAAAAAGPSELASRADVVFTIVAAPADVEELYLGADGIIDGARGGTVLVDMSTSSPALARRIAEASAARGVDALDAPVSGGPAGAESASLSIMVGGDQAAFERVRPLFGLLGHTIVHQGPAGSGQSAKTANQIALAGAMLGLCEAYAFTRGAGLDPQLILETIEAGITGSALTRFIWQRLSAGDMTPGFRVEHMMKDLGLAIEAAHAATISLPGTALVNELYRSALAAGYAGAGSQALIAGIDRGWPRAEPRPSRPGPGA